MSSVALRSNGNYHVLLTAAGAGYSRWHDLAVTRWCADATLERTGSFFYLRDEAGAVWSATPAPIGAAGDASFDASSATFSRVHSDISSTLQVAVSDSDDVELRRLVVRNLSSRPRTLSVTSFAEIVLSPQTIDATHPAFSKLFVQTEIDADSGAIMATRRMSSPDDPHAWLFHQVAAVGAAIAVSHETDRLRFIGRGHDVALPVAVMDAQPLSGSVGPVLDAVAALRATFTLDANAGCTLDFWTGVAASRTRCRQLALAHANSAAAQRVLDHDANYRNALLERLGCTSAEGAVFERLAGFVLYPSMAMRAKPDVIAANRRGQAGLWKFGISGDVPVVLLEVGGAVQLDCVRQMARAHAFWRAFGITTELMIVCGAPGTAEPATVATVAHAVQQTVVRALQAGGDTGVVDRPGGIFVRDHAALDDGDRTLLRAIARVVIDAGNGSIDAQLALCEHELAPAAPAAVTGHPPASDAVEGGSSSMAAPDGSAAATRGLVAWNGHGGFAADLREYVIESSAADMTPMPWTNVIANPAFGTLVSESGSANTWSENAHEFRLTPWSNDPVSDPVGEAIYIRDEQTGEYWSPTLLPTRGPGRFVTRHGFGYSVFTHTHDAIESQLQVYVALDAPIKFSSLTLCNRTHRARQLSVTASVEWVLGDERAKTGMHVVTAVDADTGALLATNDYNTDFAGRVAFLDIDGAGGSVCGDRRAFFGTGGTAATPRAMSEPKLCGRVGAGLDPLGAVRVHIDIPAGEARTVTIRLGAGSNIAAARDLVRSGREPGAATTALAAVHAYWRDTLGVVQVTTPDASVNALANGWLLYQTIASRLWARTAFYQSSGAFGFRDQLQDVMALVHAQPALTREHLLRAASRQFAAGDVQHWWHPPSGKGIRTRCSDDYLWLPFVTSHYVDVTADAQVLDVSCAFIEDRDLKAGEQSNYALPTVSKDAATLYDHCVRAIRHGTRYGVHGLPLMGAGDWNDGMNLVGAGGAGESVWLAFFLITVLTRFAPLAHARGDAVFATFCTREAAALRERIEASAWDGEWYRRAWFDDGTPLGSAANHECRIDSIAQSWSVLSGAAPAGRATAAMESLYARLVDQNARIVRLLDPPFDTSRPLPGYIEGYLPGTRENGGQYTHAATWAALAFAALGDGTRAWELFRMLDPVTHGATSAGSAVYKVEPYVVAGDVYAVAPNAGRGGWTWYTGSAGWLYQLLVQGLLGLTRCGARLRVRPLLPAGWATFDVRYRCGQAMYVMTCSPAASAEQAGVVVDGQAVSDGWITLHDDGGTHTVTVSVWPPAASVWRPMNTTENA